MKYQLKQVAINDYRVIRSVWDTKVGLGCHQSLVLAVCDHSVLIEIFMVQSLKFKGLQKRGVTKGTQHVQLPTSDGHIN